MARQGSRRRNGTLSSRNLEAAQGDPLEELRSARKWHPPQNQNSGGEGGGGGAMSNRLVRPGFYSAAHSGALKGQMF
ncbi:hypothetical protein R1flu_010816 [Riccia fluitans]|uniref:Uncharacterized protein n=1 Tax=Riccia fluitans TaxID=41844 RepID=A0ABD1Z621_9MARC